MASTYYLRRLDSDPPAQTPLEDGAGNILDIPNGTTVRFQLRAPDQDTLLIDAAGQVVTVDTHQEVRYVWAGSDTDLPEGVYVATWQVVWGDDGRQTTFPNDSIGDYVVITDQLG